MGGVQRLSARRALGGSRSLAYAKYVLAHLLELFWEVNAFPHRVRDGGSSEVKCSTRAWLFDVCQNMQNIFCSLAANIFGNAFAFP